MQVSSSNSPFGLVLALALTSFQVQVISCADPPEVVFMRDPINFMKSTIITTWYSSVLTAGKCTEPNNGAKTQFKLNEIKGNPLISAYSIYPKSDGEINAYYLRAGESIDVPRGIKSIVVTPELQGDSLYIRANPDKATVTIFHHIRDCKDEKSTEPGVCFLTKDKTRERYVVKVKGQEQIFDHVLALEEYGKVFHWFRIPSQSPSGAKNCGIATGLLSLAAAKPEYGGAHVTAFLKGEESGDFTFFYQKFRNSPELKNNEFFGFKPESVAYVPAKLPPYTPPKTAAKP